MSDLILEIGSNQNWNRLYDVSRQAITATPQGGFFSIPQIEIPVLVESNVLAVRVLCETSKKSWRFGGNLIQQIQIGSGGSVSPFPQTDLGLVRLRVNRTRLVVFKKYVNNFKLIFEPPAWFKDVSLTIWEYTGIQEYTSEIMLRDIQETLTELQNAEGLEDLENELQRIADALDEP